MCESKKHEPTSQHRARVWKRALQIEANALTELIPPLSIMVLSRVWIGNCHWRNLGTPRWCACSRHISTEVDVLLDNTSGW